MLNLIQPEADLRCVAFVAAMATESTVEEFEEYARANPINARPMPPYEDIHFYKYAISRGYVCGFRLVPEGGKIPFLPVKDIAIGLIIPIIESPAYVVVKGSVDRSWNHAVYWDGKQIIDPSPYAKNPAHPSEYQIKSWTPIYRLE